MILSRTSEYGLQIVLHLARHGRDGYLPVRSLAEACGIPFYFLGKICHRLTRGGILDSYKGPNGGVTLARPAGEITLLQVVESLDGLECFDGCLLGLAICDNDNPCPVHADWKKIKQELLDMLSRRTLAELAAELATGRTTLRQELRPQPSPSS